MTQRRAAALLRDDRPVVADLEAWVATLEAPGPVYLLGDPIGLYLADRPVAASVNGWSPEFYDEELWGRLVEQLEAGHPVALAADDFSRAEAGERGQAFLDLLERSWCESGRAGETTFYVPRRGGECPGG